ncbi:MAG: peptidoglycan editing factor PgeF [Acidobacteria bacterium]|nr:peptidoglycan editing factor PgeF [Acidobacteriota bacterium]
MAGFVEDSAGVLRSPLLASIEWLKHGFGTRHSESWLDRETAARVTQIHSDRVVVHTAASPACGEADAIITAEPGIMASIRTADCVPILIADPDRRVVAAIHAGWRGTAASIAAKAVGHMAAAYGSNPSSLLAAIGPAIGVCCFEVGPEVAGQFGLTGRAHIDLAGHNARQLAEAGLARIDTSGLCTRCAAHRFHSFRRDREASGRMTSAIGIA